MFDYRHERQGSHFLYTPPPFLFLQCFAHQTNTLCTILFDNNDAQRKNLWYALI